MGRKMLTLSSMVGLGTIAYDAFQSYKNSDGNVGDSVRGFTQEIKSDANTAWAHGKRLYAVAPTKVSLFRLERARKVVDSGGKSAKQLGNS